jgi:hypothetical protein
MEPLGQKTRSERATPLADQRVNTSPWRRHGFVAGSGLVHVTKDLLFKLPANFSIEPERSAAPTVPALICSVSAIV